MTILAQERRLGGCPAQESGAGVIVVLQQGFGVLHRGLAMEGNRL